jgi:hypothetical protein
MHRELDNSRLKFSLRPGERRRRLTRFAVGLLTFALFTLFFMSGYSPPGILGEVLRHNQTNRIDASPYYYTDVENMSRLEQGVREMRKRANEERH